MTTTTTSAEGLNLGRVIENTVGALKANVRPFALLGLICIALPTLLVALGGGSNPSNLAMINWPVLGLGSLIYFLGSLFLQVGVMRGVVATANGRTPAVGELLRPDVGLLIGLLAVEIVLALAVGFCFLLLIVPGVMVMCAWLLAGQVRIVEGRGIGHALDRSAELTRGHRWSIFLLLVLFTVISYAIQMVVAGLGRTVAGLGLAGTTTLAILQTVVTSILMILQVTGMAALYFELLRIKEGHGAEDLATVFD